MKISKTSIYFNNYNSFHDFDLTIVDMENIPLANETVEITNGYTIKTGEYELIELPITFRSRKANSVINSIDDIIYWLTDVNDNKLVFSFMPDKYYIVKKVKVENISRTYSRYNTIEAIFTLEPFKYENNEGILVLNNNSKIYYNGTVPGECNIKIYGNGNIQLTINSETIQINNVNEYVELDSKFLLCLNKDKTSKSRDMIGHFPLLIRGFNTVSWEGNVSKVEILPRVAYK